MAGTTSDSVGYATGSGSQQQSVRRRGPHQQRHNRGNSVGAKPHISRQDSESTSAATPDRPVHVMQDSLFSSSSGYTNYRGFLNLAVMLLVLSNARVALENMIKYGILIRPSAVTDLLLHEPYENPNLLLLLGVNAYIVAALAIEKLLYGRWLSNTAGGVLHGINVLLVLASPPLTILLRNPHPIPTLAVMMVLVDGAGDYVCVSLKLISYAHVNLWCRRALFNPSSAADPATPNKVSKMRPFMQMGSQAHRVIYPANLSLPNLYYFMFAPTLCYELNFPRSPCIRWWFVAKRTVELIGITVVLTAAAQQWIQPLIQNSIEPLVTMDIGRMTERLLKLAVPNHAMWLLGFYGMFHSALNLLAELLTFGDREFYRDWWNSETLSYFWANWNMPVHRWASRHVYKPLLRHRCPPFVAGSIVFLLSAALHEYLVSLPLQMFRLWAFIGMLAQIPLSVFTKSVRGKAGGKAGNVCVWLGLILGQPLCILMYFHDWYVLHAQAAAPYDKPWQVKH